MLCVLAVCDGFAQEGNHVRTFQFRDIELRAALDSLMRWYSVPLIYLENDVAGKRTNARCSDCDFEQALSATVEGQGLSWRRLGEQVLLQQKPLLSTFAGTVRDSLTGEAVIGADILLRRRVETESDPPEQVYRWGATNQFGFFSLQNITPGDYVLEIRRLGYHPLTQPVTITVGEGARNFRLVEQTLIHPEVTIEGRRTAFSVAEGISQGVYIRAAPTDHNQYLLEGTRVYNPVHFGGVMSAFNADALRDVHLVAGGIPPFYGGRIGGILDVALRDGMEKELMGTAEVGSLKSQLLVEGPLAPSTTLLVSARRGYPDILLPAYQTTAVRSDMNSFELTGKLTWHLSNDQRVSASAYAGRDRYGRRVAGSGMALTNRLSWGNAATGVRWVGVLSPSLFTYASVLYSGYSSEIEHAWEESHERFTSSYGIEDLSLRAHAEYFYDELHTLVAGVDLVRHRISGTISPLSSQIAPMSFDGAGAWELAVYMQDQWRLTRSVLAQLGARATSFLSKQGSFSAVDPRFSLLVSPNDDLRLHTSLSAVTQFVHPYRNSGIFLFYPSIFLYPSTQNIRPTTSLQLAVGMEKNYSRDQYRLAVESYYRITQNLHEFIFDSTMAGSLSDAGILGEGNVYGVEVTLDKRQGSVTGSVRYGIAWARNRFSELNDGRWFTPRFNRRHELYAALSYSPYNMWTVGAVCLLSANELSTVLGFRTSGGAVPGAEAFGPLDVRTPRTADGKFAYAEPYDLNGGRLPGFQRLELFSEYVFVWSQIPIAVTLRFLNGYGLIDPFVWSLQWNADARLRWRVRLDPPPIFPLYPMIGVKVRF